MDITAEEILNKHGIVNGFSVHSNPALIKQSLYDAMEEYHQSKLKDHGDIGSVIVPKGTVCDRCKDFAPSVIDENRCDSCGDLIKQTAL